MILINPYQLAPRDAYWNNTSLLLHFNGSGSTFVDSSQFNRTVSVGWGGFSQSTLDYKWGPASLGPAGGSTLYTDVTRIGTNKSWTWEAWFKRTSTGTYCAFWNDDSGNSLLGLKTPTDGGNYEFFFIKSAVFSMVGTTRIATGSWNHFAMSSDDVNGASPPTLRLFVNGVKEAQTDRDVAFYLDNRFWIGRHDYPGFAELPGYLDDVRFTCGVCRYTTDFTPPIAQFPDRG